MSTTLVTRTDVDPVAVEFATNEEERTEGTEETSADVETPVENEIPVPLE